MARKTSRLFDADCFSCSDSDSSVDLGYLNRLERLEFFASSIDIGDHVALIYDRLEGMKKIVYAYIQSGLSRNEAVIYVMADPPLQKIKKEMVKFGIDARKYEDKGGLKLACLSESNPYGGHGAGETLVHLNKLIAQFKQNGFSGLRVCRELGAFKEDELRGIIKHELRLQKRIDMDACLLCIYSGTHLMKTGGPSAISDILDAHGSSMMIGPQCSLIKQE